MTAAENTSPETLPAPAGGDVIDATDTTVPRRRRRRAQAPRRNRAAVGLSALAVATLALTACSDADAGSTEGDGAEDEVASESSVITIEDDHGTHEIDVETIDSVGAFDNHTFRTLEHFGVELTVAARSLMGTGITDYAEDEGILDTGNHREPNLELIVAAEPDLVINGQRYSQYYDDIAALLPEDGVILEFDEATTDASTYFEGLTEQTEKLGQVFQSEDAAAGLVEELDAAIERVETAYDGESTVMGLLTSGGDINYAGPNEGRGVAPIFQRFDLVPALEVDDQSSDHEGDDISVEAIAQSNPDWIIVLDRDGMAPEDPEYTPAQELIADSPALQEVTAVQEDQIVYMPQNMYLTEDIQAYTEFLEDFADALESAE
ncbi:siderophore ABC transporter substrate-binding protein [Nesterenkonia sp. HG001]|uniref:siderophore ABC transporter substrate-binding protein n=1 Tax=Nesterenkonia sp. HG001 TaxID=2983207 RepID=UPI002AC44B69|nr:ABC transporter substrate-binding protein [Nesterenkonia sp. HG001]MDZ5076594.1 ABC transporter substrate-binding protein [Nesterenkonia sp. HG001]